MKFKSANLNLKFRILGIIILIPLLITIILFLTQTSTNPQWGGGYWEKLLVSWFQISKMLAHQVVFWIRKTAHFLGYGFLGVLFWAYFSLWFAPKPYLWGIFTTGLVASFDEYLQSLSSFRSGKTTDVLIDLSGVVTLYCVIYYFLRFYKIKHK